MAERDFNAYRKSQVEKPKSLLDVVKEMVNPKKEKPKQSGPVKKETDNKPKNSSYTGASVSWGNSSYLKPKEPSKTTTKTKNSKNTKNTKSNKSNKSSNTNLISTNPSIPKKGESWGDYLEERKKFVEQQSKNKDINITKTPPKKGGSWSSAIKGSSKKETLVFDDYVPGKNDYTKEQYQWQREVDPTLPEFGSYEYFKRRERELRPIVEEIGANTDRYDETYMPWVREYGEYVEGKRDSWSRQHDPADAAEVKKLYNKIKYEDQILKEYKTVTDYVDKFDEKGVHYNLSGEVDTKSGKEEASYAAQRKQNAANALANTRLIDLSRRSLYDPISNEKQAEIDAITHISDMADVEKSKVDAYEYYEENKDNEYKNDFGGITSGNWFLGRTGIKTNDAGYAAYKAETDDLEAVEVYQLLSKRVQNNNKSTFTNDNGFKKWWSNIAQYAPQGLDQAINTVAGYALALPMALVSRSAFAKTGNALAAGINAEYMFRQTAGSAFIRQLQENKLSVEDAKKLAGDEALASAAVELALSWATGKVFQKVGGTSAVKAPIEKVGNAFTNSLKKIGISDAGTKIIMKSVVGAGKAVVSSTGEGFEEGLQEGISIVADRHAKSGEDSSAPGMLLEAFDLSKYSSDDWQRIKEAAEAGFVIGLGSNVGHVAANNGPDAIRGVTNYIGEKRVENAWTDLIKDAKTKVTDTERENAGVIRNEFTEAMDQKVVNDIDNLAKSLGVRVEVTDGVRGGTADASVNGRVIKMDKAVTRPYDFLMGHEMTHYMQSVSGEAYNRFKNLAAKRISDNYINSIYNRYTAKGVENFTYDSAVDEAVADYAGNLVSNSKNLDKFIAANRNDKGVLGTLKSAVTYLKDKLTGNSKVQAEVAEAKLTDAINDVNLENENTDFVKEQFSLKHDSSVEERLAMMRDKYGTIPKGEKPHRIVVVPKRTAKNKHVAQTIRTILEAKVTPEVKVQPLNALIAEGVFSFDRYTDKAAIADAEAVIKNKGWNVALADWINDSKRGKTSKENVALGWLLYNNAANSQDAKTAINILDYVIANQRNAGQAVQATRILKKLSPEGQLYQVARSVAHLQEDLNKKYHKKGAPELRVNTELAEQFLEAETQEQRDEILKEIYRDIGRQMPNTFMDKWRAWRYLAMLGNPRTHVRNILGNALFAPIVSTRNVISTGIQSAVYHASGGKLKRNKAYGYGGELKRAAQADYDNVSDIISGDAKYGDGLSSNKYIREGQIIFKSNIPVLRELNKALEFARKGNSKLLEKGDNFFSKPRYVSSLAHYCKANGITAEQIAKGGKEIDQARAYAILEAQKATFKDINALSNLLSKRLREDGEFAKTAATINTLIEGILPFRKTPANVLARAVEYSPVGFATTLTKGIADLKAGNITGAEFIDKLSSGLTGTGIAILGWSLASMGLIRGHGSAEEKENDFEELMGHQAYSLELPGGVSVTLDWLAPEAIPFFLGVNLYEATQETDDEPLSVSMVFDVLKRTTEPMLEMSCLQGLNDVFESVGYAANNENDAISTILITAASSIIQQSVPTLGGQIERTFEDERMTTFTEKNPNVPKDLQYLLGKLSQKLPVGWDYKQIPYIDAWGRTEKTGEPAMRAFNNFLNPSYVSEINESDMEKELKRLYNSTGENGVLPSRAKQEFTVDGETVSLDAEEYQEYATKRGEVAYDLMTEVTESYAYAELSDKEKTKVVEAVFDYATQVAKSNVSTFETEKWVKSFDEAQELGISAIDFIMENKLSPEKVEDAYELLSDKDKKLVKSTKTDESGAELKRILLMRRTDLTPEQKALLDKTCISKRSELKNPVDYTSEETFYYSQLTEAKQKRYPEVKKRWNINAKTYYRIIDACSGLTKKAEKIQALRKIGFSESDAYRFYNVVFKN